MQDLPLLPVRDPAWMRLFLGTGGAVGDQQSEGGGRGFQGCGVEGEGFLHFRGGGDFLPATGRGVYGLDAEADTRLRTGFAGGTEGGAQQHFAVRGRGGDSGATRREQGAEECGGGNRKGADLSGRIQADLDAAGGFGGQHSRDKAKERVYRRGRGLLVG